MVYDVHHNQQDLLIDSHVNKCVCTYDHHSMWIGNWVGEQNRKFYFLFLIFYFSQIMFSLVIWYFRFSKDIEYSAIGVICLIASSISIMFLVPISFFMIIFQIYLACFNFTSVEIEFPEKFIEKHAVLIPDNVKKKIYLYFFKSPFGKGLIKNLQDYFWKIK